LRVLVACEFSGRVRDAFIKQGHDAISCDILPSETPGPHLQQDVLEVLDQGWDLMIAFPPCTHICVSGNRWWAGTKEREDAVFFVESLWNAPIDKICIENPVGVLSTRSKLGKATQYIQPWQFGHPETKKTGLWLKNLPLLKETKIEEERNKNLTPSGQNKLGPSEDRWKLRSLTYQGIATAMSEQWIKK